VERRSSRYHCSRAPVAADVRGQSIAWPAQRHRGSVAPYTSAHRPPPLSDLACTSMPLSVRPRRWVGISRAIASREESKATCSTAPLNSWMGLIKSFATPIHLLGAQPCRSSVVSADTLGVTINFRMLPPNPPVNADARDVPTPAKAAGARAGYRER
jgi:hypothetical protein